MMKRWLLLACGILFIVWCALVILFPVWKAVSGAGEITGDFLAIMLIHLVMGSATYAAMTRGQP